MEETYSQGNSNVLAEMNNVLARKEEIFKQREEQVQEKLRSLEAFEQKLIAQAKQLKADKEAFKEEVSRKEEELAEQRKEIAAKWEEVRSYEAKYQASMEELLSEQVKLQEKDNKQLEQTLQKETEAIMASTVSAELKQLMSELDDEEPENKEKEVPPIIKQFEAASYAVFPKGFVIEKTPERICLSIGSREIRIFASDTPEIHVVESRKNDKKLQMEIVQMNRVQSLWQFEYKENHLVGRMQFSSKASAEGVLKEAKKVIEEQFK